MITLRKLCIRNRIINTLKHSNWNYYCYLNRTKSLYISQEWHIIQLKFIQRSLFATMCAPFEPTIASIPRFCFFCFFSSLMKKMITHWVNLLRTSTERQTNVSESMLDAVGMWYVEVGMLNDHSQCMHKSHSVDVCVCVWYSFTILHSLLFFSVFYAETDICNCAFSYLVHLSMCVHV